jgi:hypothetical protein
MTASNQPLATPEEVRRQASRYILEQLGNRLWADEPAYDEPLQRWTVPIHARALPEEVVLGEVLLDRQGVVIQAPSREAVQRALEQHHTARPDTRLRGLVYKQLLDYLNEPGTLPSPTPTEWDCLLVLGQPASQQGLTPNEVRDRLSRRASLAVISDALQTVAKKGYLIEEQRERPSAETTPALPVRGVKGGAGTGGPETVYRLVPKKMAAALCHGLLAGTVPPSGEMRQALLGLVETLGVPPEILEQLRKG